MQDGYLLTSLNQINGEYYYFYNDGSMVHNDWVYISGVYYLFDDNGAMLTRADTDHGNGWIYRDAWYFINEDNTLAEGWLYSGNSPYYMEPEMVCNTVKYIEGLTYAFEYDGKAKTLGDGLYTVGYGYDSIIVYTYKNRPVTDAWKQIGGYWYYFDSNGHACRSGVRSVGGNRYLFNQYGQMQTGWAIHYGEWYYADPNNDSILVTGKQTIGGVTYIFDAYGSMYYDCFCYYDGGIYRLATNGAVTKTLTEGWNQIDQDWYYVQDGSLVYDQMLQINGKYYFFDDEGKMLNGGLVYYYGSGFVTDADGALQTGWQKVNGKWVYAYPGSYRIIENGWEIIGDKRYFFDEDGFLRYGTINWYGSVYVTDADGAATYKEEVKSGWYLEDNGWYYYENGNAYDGWLGDYYLNDGYMAYDDIIEYNGRHYYLQPNGKLLRNGWAEYANYYWGEKLWILARADGSLYCSEWAQQGSTWYYFDGHYMAYDGVYNIGKEAHEFDEDGKWLGEVTDSSDPFANKPDGWLETRDGYYYILGGSPVYGEIYWQGDYYYLSGYDGLMIANSVNDTYYGSAQRYYDASGRAVEYVGWKQIGGNWYYFNADHTVFFGLASDSQGLCYVYPYYTDDGKIVSKLAKKEYVEVGSSLYYFDANGYTKGAISHNGWYNADGEWYYFENGALVGYGYREIGGVGYYFYGGLMAHDTTVYINGNAYYVNKNGAVVTRKGWYQLDGEWIYVKDGGHLIEYGIHIIDGKEYTFSNYILIYE